MRRVMPLESGVPTTPNIVSEKVSKPTAQPAGTKTISAISTPTKSKKLEYTAYNSNKGKNVTISGYRLTVPEFPNVELYLTNEFISSESVEGTTKFNIQSKEWHIEVIHPTKGIMTIPTPGATTISKVIATFTDDINNKHSKSEQGIKVLKELGMDFTKPISTDTSTLDDWQNSDNNSENPLAC